MTKRFSSETRKVIPLTRTSSEASTGQSATVGAIREVGCAQEEETQCLSGIQAGFGAELRDTPPTSWIERIGPATPLDTAALLDALDDDDRARELRLRRAELELVHQSALIEALGHEQERLRGEVAQLEDELIELDAEMLLCLARGGEQAAHAVIRRIIPHRRRITLLRSGIERISAERVRLACSVSRQRLAFPEIAPGASTPLSFECTARRSPRPPGYVFSSAAPTPPGRRGTRATLRDHPEESL